MGYQIYRLQTPTFECFTFENVVNVVAFSFIQVLLWLPLKIIRFCKVNLCLLSQVEPKSAKETNNYSLIISLRRVTAAVEL